jgi:Prasinovirus endonuclease VII
MTELEKERLEKRRASKRRYREQNREKIRESNRQYREQNRERCNAAIKKWQLKNIEDCRAACRRYYMRNRDKIRAACRAAKKKWARENRERLLKYHREWEARQRKNNPRFRISRNLRTRIYQALRGKTKSAKTLELLGCSVEHLKVWLTLYFQPGMSWSNYGTCWHIDHIRPCVSFDLTDPKQQKECFNYTNLQPLFAIENLKKGSKYDHFQSQ